MKLLASFFHEPKIQDAHRDALVKYGNLIRQNREQLHWLEAVLTGKDSGFCGFEINAAAELFICKTPPSHRVVRC
jgi:hypothetical protein